jgi:hypothetical protein
VITAVAACAALLSGDPAQAAPTATEKCQQAKLKAQGKLRLCLSKNAAGLLLGKPDAEATCREKFVAALAKADAKALEAATTCRFVDGGDGTVHDLDTGLQWEKKTTDASIHDVNQTFTWTATGTAPDGSAFSAFLPALNSCVSPDGSFLTTGFAGYCDWRLPTVVELQSILTAGCTAGPCIDPVFGPTLSTMYYTATQLPPGQHWNVSFFQPGFPLNFTTVTFSFNPVRAVRGGL